MPKLAAFDRELMRRTLGGQHQVISRSQAFACGISPVRSRPWCRPDGKWQKLLPGVYLTVTGKPTAEQRLVAAILYAGQVSAITGPAAIRLHRLRSPGSDVIDVLIPWSAKRQSTGFVVSTSPGECPSSTDGGDRLRHAGSRGRRRRASVRIAGRRTVRRRRSGAEARLLDRRDRAGSRAGGSHDSARLRTALAEVQAGVRSVAEARFRQRVLKSDLPTPQFNVFLRAADGTDIGEVDAWWAGRAFR